MDGGKFVRIILRLLLPLVLAAGGGVAHAQAGLVGLPVSACVLRAAPGMTPAVLLQQHGGFDCTTPQTDFGSGDFWVRSKALSIGGNQPFEVRIASLWQSRVTLHALYADGTIVSLPTDGCAASRHIQLGAIIEREVPARGIPVVRLLWHVEGSANLRGILNGPRIATPAESARSNLELGALYAGFIGVCIALLTYNLALWGALRYRFQLAYCAMVSALLVYAISSSGALAWMWPGIANNDRLRINYLMLALSASAALAFAHAFFEDRVFTGWLRRTSNAAIVAVTGSALVFVAFTPLEIGVLDRLYAVTFMGLIAVVIPVLWRAWRTRSNYLWLFAIGWAAPIALAVARIAHTLHIIPWNFWLDNSTLFSMTVEALVSALAIAYRIRLLSRERDDARIQEAAARLLADTDPLTGLLNRRAFLRDAIGRDGDQTLLLADIDHFKHVNDTLGHDGGDEVLRVFARALRASVPRDALVARIGGEEFAIVATPGAALEPEPILARLRAERMPFDLTVTASIGMCTGPLQTESNWKLLYRSADHALFEAKKGGRDRARSAYAIAAAA